MKSSPFERAKWALTTVLVFKNWVEIYRRKFSSAKQDRQVLQLRNGLSFEVAQKEHNLPILVEVLHREVYSEGVDTTLVRPVIIDIGGNIGASSIYFLRGMPSATLYVYEPEPLNFELLGRNLERNGVRSRATPVRQAVGGQEGERTLYFATNSPANSFFRQVGQGVEVQCVTLERIFSDHQLTHCDLLKIDCEGAEYEILMGAPTSLLEKVRTIVLEWHTVQGHSPQALESYLVSLGFRTHRPSARFIVAKRTPEKSGSEARRPAQASGR
jgi:FkbM family methyltransferase